MNKSLLLLILTLAGCGAQMVKPLNTGSKYAPVNEGDGIGIVSYRIGRTDMFNKSQREDAYKQMYEQCNSKYRIEREWTDAEENGGGFALATVNGAKGQGASAFSFDQTLYQHIAFTCVK